MRGESGHVLGPLGQDHADLDLLVLDALGLLRALEEGHVQDIAARRRLAQKVLGVRVPANGKGKLPPAKQGVAGLDLEQGLALVGAEVRRRDVANDVRVVGVAAADAEREAHLAQDVPRGQAEVLVLDAAEEVRQVGAALDPRVALLKGDVAAPVADLDVALQLGHVVHGPVELEADLHGLDGPGSLLVKGAVRELGALLDGELGDISAPGEPGVVGDVGKGKLDLGLLLGRGVGRGAVRRERVGEELRFLDVDGGGEGLVGVQDVVADADGLLRAGLEGGGELDAKVLRVPVGGQPSILSKSTDATNLFGSTSTISATKGPAFASLRSLTSTPPNRATWSVVKGRKYSSCGCLAMFSIRTLMFSLT